MTGNYIKILIVYLTLILCIISWDSFDQKWMQSLGFMKQNVNSKRALVTSRLLIKYMSVNELLLLQLKTYQAR